MARNKNESLSIRTTPEIKELLRLAAERERRSIASMIEAMVVDYARLHGLVQASTISEHQVNLDGKHFIARNTLNEEEQK